MFEPLDGQPVARGDQVLMSAPAMAKFNAQIGDRITVPGVGQIHIAGRVRDPGDWSRAVMVMAAEPDQLALVGQRHSWLVGGIPVNGRGRVIERIRRELDTYARASAATVDTDVVAADEITSGFANGAAEPPRRDGQLWGRSPVPGALGTAAVLIVIAVFAVAAFAVDHRQRMRHAGVLVAVGATPSQITSVASFEALLIGGAGVVFGRIVMRTMLCSNQRSASGCASTAPATPAAAPGAGGGSAGAHGVPARHPRRSTHCSAADAGIGPIRVVMPWIAISMIAVGLPVAVGTIVTLVSRALPVQPPIRRIT